MGGAGHTSPLPNPIGFSLYLRSQLIRQTKIPQSTATFNACRRRQLPGFPARIRARGELRFAKDALVIFSDDDSDDAIGMDGRFHYEPSKLIDPDYLPGDFMAPGWDDTDNPDNPDNPNNLTEPAESAEPAPSTPVSARAAYPQLTDAPTDPLSYPIVPGLFPRHSINLMVYSPHTGTMRFLLPQLDNYADPSPSPSIFLEIPVPAPRWPLGMVLCSRFPDEIRQKISHLDLHHLTPQSFPITRYNGKPTKDKSENLEAMLLFLHESLDQLTYLANGRQPRFLVIESMHALIPPHQPNDPHPIIDFYTTARTFCETRDCTILGTVIASKARPGSAYDSLSHRISGNAQWGVGASTIIGLEETNRQSTLRKITIHSRSARTPLGPLWADFSLSGRLDLCSSPDSRREGTQTRLDEALACAEIDQEFTRADFLAWGDAMGVTARTVDRWIRTAVEYGFLERDGATRSATYRKPGSRIQ